jgi:hypothetical protein
LPNTLEHFPSVPPGNVDIEQRDIRPWKLRELRVAADIAISTLAFGEYDGLEIEACASQHFGQEKYVSGIVFEYEDVQALAAFHGISPAGNVK